MNDSHKTLSDADREHAHAAQKNVDNIRAIGNWIVCERERWGEELRSNLHLPPSIQKGTISIWARVLSVGPNVREGTCKPGDHIVFIQSNSLVNTEHTTSEDKDALGGRNLTVVHEGHILCAIAAEHWAAFQQSVYEKRKREGVRL